MLPEAFFARGVIMLGGIQVTKPDELLNIISVGGSGYHFFGRYAERTVISKSAEEENQPRPLEKRPGFLYPYFTLMVAIRKI